MAWTRDRALRRCALLLGLSLGVLILLAVSVAIDDGVLMRAGGPETNIDGVRVAWINGAPAQADLR